MLISMKAKLLLHSLSTEGLNLGLSTVEADIRLYERQDGSMSDGVSYIRNSY